MLPFTLTPPTLADAPALLAFECDNRGFFERHINARPPAYYSLDGVSAAIDLALREAQADTGRQYLVKGEGGCILARVNLSRLRRAHFHSAELGYRVAEAFTGQGLARAAVAQVRLLAFGRHGLQRLEACASSMNEASATVLSRLGFRQYGRSRRSFELHGVWHDLLHFECRADEPESDDPAMRERE